MLIYGNSKDWDASNATVGKVSILKLIYNEKMYTNHLN